MKSKNIELVDKSEVLADIYFLINRLEKKIRETHDGTTIYRKDLETLLLIAHDVKAAFLDYADAVRDHGSNKSCSLK